MCYNYHYRKSEFTWLRVLKNIQVEAYHTRETVFLLNDFILELATFGQFGGEMLSDV